MKNIHMYGINLSSRDTNLSYYDHIIPLLSIRAKENECVNRMGRKDSGWIYEPMTYVDGIGGHRANGITLMSSEICLMVGCCCLLVLHPSYSRLIKYKLMSIQLCIHVYICIMLSK